MSWLNFNESLSSLKGQLSSFASGVLADGIVGETGSDDHVCDSSSAPANHSVGAAKDRRQELLENGTSWDWDPPGAPPRDQPPLVAELQRRVALLEEDKRELTVSLEQLDADCQQATDKLVVLRDELQMSYNELKAEFEGLQREYAEVLAENLQKTKELERAQTALRASVEEARRLQEENEGLMRKLQELQANGKLHVNKEEDEWKTLTDRYDKTKKLADHLQDTLDKLKDAEECPNRNCQQLQAQHLQLSGNCKKLQAELEDLQRLKKINEDFIQNLQTENRKLREDIETFRKSNEETLHQKYLSIISESMKRYMDADTRMTPLVSEEQPQIAEFANKVEALVKLLLGFKIKTEALEKELCEVTREKNEAIKEKNCEIEKLLKNSEILSQEVITKSQALKDYEDECAELMKNNDLLISELQNYKNNSGLQTISESNEDNLLMLESQLETSNKRIQDLELIISDLENSKQEINLETETELEYIKKQLNMTGQELSLSKQQYQDMLLHCKGLEEQKQSLKTALDKVKLDYENTEYKYDEANISMESLKEENEECKGKCGKLETVVSNLEAKNDLLENLLEDIKQKLEVEIENGNQKELQIRSLVERLQSSKMGETSLKLQVDTMCKELQAITEMKHGLEAKYNESESRLRELEEKYKEHANDEVREIKSECDELKATITKLLQQHSEMQQKIAGLEAQVVELLSTRNDLVTQVTAKHQESVQYYAEIQRLNQLLAIESEKTRCSVDINALTLQHQEEVEKLTDQNNFLREKCEVLTQNLLQEQSNIQKAAAERSAATEREQVLEKELERLRVHLVEIEDTYTQELVEAEQKNKEMQAKVNEIEQREKDSSSMYTSVSIRANQQVESLQTQLQLITNQRDELRVRVSDLEDEQNKQAAALTNLQLVLEQFQKEKEVSIYQETERVRRQISAEKQIQQELRAEIGNLKLQLEESKQGLQAAARLTDQLEKCKQQCVNLKDEVLQLQERLKASEAKCRELGMQSDLKVDKTLLKNLIIGYVNSHSNDQKQILKIIATVLDFSQKESDKVNLNKSQHAGGWLSSILHPQGFGSGADISQQSLSEAFVRFLENESRPKVLPNLLNTSHVANSSSSTATTPRQSPSPLVLSEVVLPTFVDFGKTRNSSSILKDVLKDSS